MYISFYNIIILYLQFYRKNTEHFWNRFKTPLVFSYFESSREAQNKNSQMKLTTTLAAFFSTLYFFADLCDAQVRPTLDWNFNILFDSSFLRYIIRNVTHIPCYLLLHSFECNRCRKMLNMFRYLLNIFVYVKGFWICINEVFLMKKCGKKQNQSICPSHTVFTLSPYSTIITKTPL